jgi:hypothetical protein
MHGIDSLAIECASGENQWMEPDEVCRRYQLGPHPRCVAIGALHCPPCHITLVSGVDRHGLIMNDGHLSRCRGQGRFRPRTCQVSRHALESPVVTQGSIWFRYRYSVKIATEAWLQLCPGRIHEFRARSQSSQASAVVVICQSASERDARGSIFTPSLVKG